MSWANEWGANASFAILVVVIVADALFGTLPGLRRILDLPLNVIKALTRWFDSKLNRVRRGGEARRMRGLLVVLIITIVAWGSGFAVDAVARVATHGWIIEAFALLFLIRQRDCLDRMRSGWRNLAERKPDDAKALVGAIVRYDTKPLDEFGIARAAIEGGTARFSDRFLATLFWYLLLGLPGVFVCRAINATADVIGRPSSRHASFGFAATRMDDVLNLVPSIAAGPIVAFAALFVPQTGAIAALTGWWRDLRERAFRTSSY